MDRLLGPEDRSPVHYFRGWLGLFPSPRGQPRWSLSSPAGTTRRSVHAGLATSLHLSPGNSVLSEGMPLSRRLTRVRLGDIQDQRHVVAMRQPIFGIPYAEIGRDSVAQECAVNVMPEAEVPGVTVRFSSAPPLGRSPRRGGHAAKPKPSKLFDQHAVVPNRMRPVPGCVAVEVPHEQGVAAGKVSSVAVHDLMGDANIPYLAIQLMRPKGNDVEAVDRKGKVPGQIGIRVFRDYVASAGESNNSETFVQFATGSCREGLISRGDVLLGHLLENDDVGLQRLDQVAFFVVRHRTVPRDDSHWVPL